jgi:hypothetical protein
MKARKRARKAATPPTPSVVDVDPGDLSQRLDEAGQFQIEPLDIEAQPESEAAAALDLAIDLAGEEDETDREDQRLGLGEAGEVTADDLAAATRKDIGELYGLHIPPASDTDLAAGPDQASFEDATLGESFTEELATRAVEGGALPEHELDIVDDSHDAHPTHHSTESGDRPVADKGSGGPGGL